jgi:hypothetical protein
MSVFFKEKYESKVNARQLTLHDNDGYGRLVIFFFFMEITCGKSCLNFDGEGKIKWYR